MPSLFKKNVYKTLNLFYIFQIIIYSNNINNSEWNDSYILIDEEMSPK